MLQKVLFKIVVNCPHQIYVHMQMHAAKQMQALGANKVSN